MDREISEKKDLTFAEQVKILQRHPLSRLTQIQNSIHKGPNNQAVLSIKNIDESQQRKYYYMYITARKNFVTRYKIKVVSISNNSFCISVGQRQLMIKSKMQLSPEETLLAFYNSYRRQWCGFGQGGQEVMVENKFKNGSVFWFDVDRKNHEIMLWLDGNVIGASTIPKILVDKQIVVGFFLYELNDCIEVTVERGIQ